MDALWRVIFFSLKAKINCPTGTGPEVRFNIAANGCNHILTSSFHERGVKVWKEPPLHYLSVAFASELPRVMYPFHREKFFTVLRNKITHKKRNYQILLSIFYPEFVKQKLEIVLSRQTRIH